MTEKIPAIAPLSSTFEFTTQCEKEKKKRNTGLLPDITDQHIFLLGSCRGANYLDRFRVIHYAFTAGGGQK